MTFKDRIEVLAAVAGVTLACFTLGYQVYQQNQVEAGKQVDAWQRAVVHEIMVKSEHPLTFNQIFDRYRGEVVNDADHFEIPKGRQTKRDLARTLLTLREKRIVGYDGQSRYFMMRDAVAVESKFIRIALEKEAREKARLLAVKALMQLGTANEAELFKAVHDSGSSLELEEFSEVIALLIDYGSVVSIDGRLQLRGISSSSSSGAQPVEVLRIWVPAAGGFEGQYSKNRLEFEAWLSDNFEWWSRAQLDSLVTAGKSVGGWTYEAEGIRDDGTLKQSENQVQTIQLKVASTFQVADGEFWIEIQQVSRL